MDVIYLIFAPSDFGLPQRVRCSAFGAAQHTAARSVQRKSHASTVPVCKGHASRYHASSVPVCKGRANWLNWLVAMQCANMAVHHQGGHAASRATASVWPHLLCTAHKPRSIALPGAPRRAAN